MFPPGHVGLAIGAAWLTEAAVNHYGANLRSRPQPIHQSGNLSALHWIDYRIVILGSLLPDIIDKPIWFLSQGALFPSGRSYAHSFLFSLILLVAGLILQRFRKSWLTILSLSSFSHLILDEMWKSPATLWWPFYGELTRVTDTRGWLGRLIQPLLAQPNFYSPEMIGELLGLFIIFVLTLLIVKRRDVTNFIKTGTIS